MASSTDVSAWKVKELREWLDANDVPYLKSAKKGELVALVESARAASAKSSAAARVEPSKMTIDSLIAWLTEHDVSLPATRQKKGFYVDLVEKHASAPATSYADVVAATSPTPTVRKRAAPSTAPRSARPASQRRSVVKEKAKSASPTRRRSIRRKLLDMPSDDEDEASSSVSRPKTVSPGHRRQAPSADAQTAGKARAVFIGALLLAVCAGYISFILIMKYRSG
ncbi:HeH/LEM domain-containing protein [Plasmodiophora brassicae]|uniref:HeH/LEM domain-containing protein n=1 Tax=Plasmodiophora brassicae TaxID=37360 RepID=A0A0G4IJE8_PLABS|nr:hypothetical protein PBRA_003973 [Plasmodiophora brassicae]SPQ96344.1 unnamed protein product [Plasmodiophora brassicae]